MSPLRDRCPRRWVRHAPFTVRKEGAEIQTQRVLSSLRVFVVLLLYFKPLGGLQDRLKGSGFPVLGEVPKCGPSHPSVGRSSRKLGTD